MARNAMRWWRMQWRTIEKELELWKIEIGIKGVERRNGAQASNCGDNYAALMPEGNAWIINVRRDQKGMALLEEQ